MSPVKCTEIPKIATQFALFADSYRPMLTNLTRRADNPVGVALNLAQGAGAEVL